MNFKLLHPADQIVMLMKRIYGYGMTTTSGGNLSIIDEEGNIWISPAGVDKGSLTFNDIICIKANGDIIGNHKPSSEYPFHQLIYKTRPDIKAVVHAHPPALVAFSIARKIPDTHLIPNINLVCGGVGMAEYGLPGSIELGEKVVKEFIKGSNTVILENHGIVVGGEDLFKAFMAFETMDFCARLEINANIIGKTSPLTNEQIEISKIKNNADIEEFVSEYYGSNERAIRREMCQLIHRAYDQELFTSTQGTFSQRIDEDNFVITPYNTDRKYIEVGDLVKISKGKKEKGKMPSRSVLMHQEIYKRHPHVNSVIIAHPPNIMAFAVTEEVFDSRTIPESYILLRSVPKIPFGASFMQPGLTADIFKKDTPIAMVENDCVIVTGSSLLNAFDRLEVLEYSAKAIIAAKHIGKIVTISDTHINDLIKAFHLE
ncbi:MAG: class II aldolase/adducin family protein [Clostridia bacterium]|nr:class II aldolase/adducin family protein [Clostridia bacterium]